MATILRRFAALLFVLMLAGIAGAPGCAAETVPPDRDPIEVRDHYQVADAALRAFSLGPALPAVVTSAPTLALGAAAAVAAGLAAVPIGTIVVGVIIVGLAVLVVAGIYYALVTLDGAPPPGAAEAAVIRQGVVVVEPRAAPTPVAQAAAASGQVTLLFERADPGDCTAALHAELQAEVDRACGLPRRRNDARFTCADLDARRLNATECLNARVRINTTCYGGGDRSHTREAETVTQTLAFCTQRMRDLSCPELVGVVPPPPEPAPTPPPDPATVDWVRCARPDGCRVYYDTDLTSVSHPLLGTVPDGTRMGVFVRAGSTLVVSYPMVDRASAVQLIQIGEGWADGGWSPPGPLPEDDRAYQHRYCATDACTVSYARDTRGAKSVLGTVPRCTRMGVFVADSAAGWDVVSYPMWDRDGAVQVVPRNREGWVTYDPCR